MKHLIQFIIAPIVALALSVSMAFAGEEAAPAVTKVGVVNWQQLLTKAPQAEEAGKRLEKEFQARESKLMAKQKEFQTKQEKLHRDREVLSEAERSKLERDLSKMQQDLRHLDEEYRSDRTARHREEMDEFLNLVREEVEKLAQEEKYDLVLPQETTMFMAERIDITDKVMQRLASKAKTAKSDKSDKK